MPLQLGSITAQELCILGCQASNGLFRPPTSLCDQSFLNNFAGAETADLVIARMLDFWQFFNSISSAARSVLSIRDLLAWARFINSVAASFDPLAAYAHGAYLVLLDGIGLGTGMQMEVASLFLHSSVDQGGHETESIDKADKHSAPIALSSNYWAGP